MTRKRPVALGLGAIVLSGLAVAAYMVVRREVPRSRILTVERQLDTLSFEDARQLLEDMPRTIWDEAPLVFADSSFAELALVDPDADPQSTAWLDSVFLDGRFDPSDHITIAATEFVSDAGTDEASANRLFRIALPEFGASVQLALGTVTPMDDGGSHLSGTVFTPDGPGVVDFVLGDDGPTFGTMWVNGVSTTVFTDDSGRVRRVPPIESVLPPEGGPDAAIRSTPTADSAAGAPDSAAIAARARFCAEGEGDRASVGGDTESEPDRVVVDVLLVADTAAASRMSDYGMGPWGFGRNFVVEQWKVASKERVSLRLVDAMTVEYEPPEPDDIRTDWTWVRADPAIAHRRDQTNADLVVFVVDRATGPQDACGWGDFLETSDPPPGFGYAAVPFTCAFKRFSILHEIGHAFGIAHDPGEKLTPLCEFAHGYTHRFANRRTAMAVASSSAYRIPHFSTTGSHPWLPDAIGEKGVSEADRMIRLTASRVAALRPRPKAP